MNNEDGCQHYRRHCELKAPCCNEFYTCRKCHDHDVPGHTMDRFNVSEMRCLYCMTTQSVSNECVVCHRQMAHYYCEVCHLFNDDTTQSIIHCVHCGVCMKSRGPDNEPFEHCFQCNNCLPVGHTVHYDFTTVCPICQEHMVGSPIILPGCGHAMHQECERLYIEAGNYKCPLCMVVLDYLDMSPVWSDMDNAIRNQPMPVEYADVTVSFQCNDCHTRHSAPINFIGYKCPQCGGYNTAKVQ